MLKYVQAFADRHGRMRYYFRKPGSKRIALPGAPHSPEFHAAYAAALGEARRPIASVPAKAGSIAALVDAYYASGDYKALRESTKRAYRGSLEPFRREYGHLGVKSLRPENVRTILDRLSDKPAMASNLRKRLRQIMQWGAERGWRDDNPVLVVARSRRKTEGFIPWSEEDIAAFERRWPSGTRERLALALLLYTGQRRSDVPSMGRQHVKEGRIHVRQVKTDKRVAIRIHPVLQVELDRAPKDQLAFLLTEYGKPFTTAGFGKWFSARARLAGLADRAAHGLRKAAGRRLAEAGCSSKQIMAILGHDSLEEAEKYVRAADDLKLGDAAISALVRAGSGTEVSTPSDGFDNAEQEDER